MDWQGFVFFGGLLALWSGIIIATLKWMLDKSDRHMGERLEVLSKNLDTFRNDVHASALELQRFRTYVAETYVRSEDWTRFAVTIDSKIDRIRRKLDGSA